MPVYVCVVTQVFITVITGGCLHLWFVPGWRWMGSPWLQTDRAAAKGPLHSVASGARVRSQLHRTQGPKTLSVPCVQEASAYRPDLHHPSVAQDSTES